MRTTKVLFPLATVSLLCLVGMSAAQDHSHTHSRPPLAMPSGPSRPQSSAPDAQWTTESQKGSESLKAPKAPDDHIVTDEKFTKDGVITYPDFTSLGMKIKAEAGILNGVAYRIYYSGGADFVGERGGSLDGRPERVNWHVGCHKDDFTDVKSCVLSTRDMRIHLFADGDALISIGGDIHPGSDVAVRIDDDSAFIGGDEGRIAFTSAGRIVERLKTARVVKTRWVRWPSESTSQEEWEQYGYNEALQFALWALPKLK